MTLVLLAHAAALLAMGRVRHPGWGLVAALGLGAWRIGFGALRRVGTDRRWPDRADLLSEGGTLIIAAAMIAADGGTESPFFFWTLLILAWQALVSPFRRLVVLAVIAATTYLGVVVAANDITTTSTARFGLLAAYCTVLAVGRLRLEHHQMEAHQAGQLLNDAFAAAPIGLAVVAGDPQCVVYANTTATHLALREVMEGPGAAARSFQRLVEEARSIDAVAGPELVVVRAAGAEPRYLRVMATPHRPNGDDAVVVCAEDVTAQVNVGEERRRFLLLASHQLRTPLTPIIAYAELLKEHRVADDELADVADEIIRAGHDLEMLFDRMAAVTRLQRAAPQEPESVETGEILAAMQRLDPGILDDVDIRGDHHEVARCDPELTARALRELIDNGRRFGQAPVRLSWRRTGDAVEFQVSDSGPGPDPTLTDQALFGDWGQGRDGYTMASGMGTRLGLLQARLLAELTGGELTLQRNEDDWAFTLRVVEPTRHSGPGVIAPHIDVTTPNAAQPALTTFPLAGA
ncbi:MAG TPA: HAMP domain-containing sensor histidine kinase [Acidimicrobiia bacterium]